MVYLQYINVLSYCMDKLPIFPKKIIIFSNHIKHRVYFLTSMKLYRPIYATKLLEACAYEKGFLRKR
jgi:hypothetical protein